MTYEQTTLFIILGLAMAGFIWGRWRYDLVAFGALLAAVILGVVPSGEAFLGFGHPATITVAAVLILTRALSNSGAVDLLADRLKPATRSPTRHIGTLLGIGAPLSAIMNNVGALSLLMPVAVQSAIKAKRSPATVLMPLSFGTILGGLVTVIGTPPNIIIATYRGRTVGEPFGMFDFTPVGAATAVTGLLFIAFVGWRLIPRARRVFTSQEEVFRIEDYVAEAKIAEGSDSIGKNLGDMDDLAREQDVVIIGIIRGDIRIFAAARHQLLRPDDILVLEGGPAEIDKFVTARELELEGTGEGATAFFKTDNIVLSEAVVTPASQIVGRSARNLRLAARYGINLLALSRQGRPLTDRINSVRFHIGDVLLLQGEEERLHQVIAALGCLPLAERRLQLGPVRQVWLSVGIFAGAVLLAAFGALSLPVSFSLAVVGVVLLNIVPPRQIYESIDWPVIVLLGAMIPVGEALQTTGATQVIARLIGDVTSGAPPIAILAVLMAVTMLLTNVMNNAATAVVGAPIAMGIANHLGANPDGFLMAVAVGASSAFLTPIGHQNNTLIMGPGGYHFGDFWRMGLPLQLLILAVSVPLIPLVFPL